MTQEAVKQEPVELSLSQETKKKQLTAQEIIESFRSTSDDIGQISELSSEERILVSQFFSSLLKLMKPLAPSIVVNQTSLPPQVGDVVQAHVDPTGHLLLQYTDGHVELLNLSDDKNRDIMMAVVADVMPKFKNLTSNQKRKLENRIKLLSSVTKELQKSSDALSAALTNGQ